ncbi:lyso-ornithine lipid O-acyltransferase [Ancylobacter lacus]|uniref:lysophospholipid acyltransferase family protein n=1 Tax=Ancylobacter lacus TaxID=2579970 RepID=UPI001BCF340D|nr:lysophospholipid acyltransferase family protein [Ancylobacter lacus]MBS7539682.1 1-acyl-sn-glycerol-3-phosphate acyltransferase [Ancylobacter lacus]
MRVWAVLVAVVLATLIGLPLQWLSLRLGLPSRRWIPPVFHRLLLALIGVRVTSHGTPAGDRPLIIVANHVSWLDIPVLGSRMPLGFIAKSEVGRWPGIGMLARLQRTVFVDRSSRAATGRVNEAIAARLREGDPVVLFAEGTSSDGNRVLPFRSALLGATREAFGGGPGAVVQPVAIAYVRQAGLPLGRARRPLVAWYGDMDLVPHLAEVLRRGAIDVELHFGEPIAGGDRKAVTLAAERASRALLAAALTGRSRPPDSPA